MIRERVVPVVLSVLVIVLVAILQERSRYLAAIAVTVPLTAPLAMWIVYGANSGDIQAWPRPRTWLPGQMRACIFGTGAVQGLEGLAERVYQGAATV
jgi:hypothetical protein